MPDNDAPEPQVHPVGAPARNPISDAANAARENLATETLEPETHPGGTEVEAGDPPVEEAKVWSEDPVDPSTELDVDAEPELEAEPAAHAPEAEAGDEPELEEELEEAPEAEADDEEAPEAEDEEDEPFVLSLPGRRPDDDDIEVEFGELEPEVEEAIRRMRNGYMRGEQLRSEKEQLDDVREIVGDVVSRLEHDPINFIYEYVQDEVQVDLAKHLLSNPAVFDAVVEDVAAWHRNPEQRELAATKLELDRRKQRDEALTRQQTLRESRESARVVRNTLDALIPEGMSDLEAQHWQEEVALHDIKRYAEANNATRIGQQQVLDILEKSGALRRAGLTRSDAERQLAAHSASTPDAPGSARAERPSAQARRVEEARKTGEKLKRRTARRKAAASVPRGGAAPSAPARPPKGMGVEEAVAWRRKQLAANRR